MRRPERLAARRLRRGADGLPGVVPVRDSKLAGAGPVLAFRASAWAPFIQAVKYRA
ncbi:DUF397 domain-containing protein [Streptomyces sp. NPDC005533]|uniref:DUF397 domain-containing protein n=1 Tax=Streptomyces sp. NPDC005533 TaxID=3364723 RepID=UPI0036872AB4